jgi:hypothetical protein
MSFFFNHLNEKTKFKKMGPRRALIEEEDSTMITWTLAMQKCGLSISLQQFEMKVVELT